MTAVSYQYWRWCELCHRKRTAFIWRRGSVKCLCNDCFGVALELYQRRSVDFKSPTVWTVVAILRASREAEQTRPVVTGGHIPTFAGKHFPVVFEEV